MKADFLPLLGNNLRRAKKHHFPQDTLREFALRIGVSKATYQKMEKGDLSVSLGSYYTAARVLGLQQDFDALFTVKGSLFDD